MSARARIWRGPGLAMVLALLACARPPGTGTRHAASPGEAAPPSRESPAKAPNEDGAADAGTPRAASANLRAAGAPAGAELRPKGLRPKPKTPIFVGGCREACREPVSAFRAFLAAIPGDPHGKRVSAFINTAELVLNGERVGERWATLWKAGRWPERQADVVRVTGEWLGWYRTLPDPPEFEDARARGVRVVRDESELAEIAWRHPRLADDLTAGEWRFVLRPRGLEWLIVEIDQYTEPRTE